MSGTREKIILSTVAILTVFVLVCAYYLLTNIQYVRID
jgi:hypothetical protein